MRKRLALLSALALVSVMAFGVIGSGASFSATSSVSQTFNVGSMTLTLTPVSPGETVNADGSITCAPVLIKTSMGSDTTCSFSIASAGTIPAGSLKVNVSETGLSGSQLSNHKFSVNQNGTFGGSSVYVTTTTQQLYSFTAAQLPVTVNPQTWWGFPSAPQTNLDNTDFGSSLVITYAIVAAE